MDLDVLKQMHVCVAHIIELCHRAKTVKNTILLDIIKNACQEALRELIPKFPTARDVCLRYCEIEDLRSVSDSLLQHKYPEDYMADTKRSVDKLLNVENPAELVEMFCSLTPSA